MRENGAFGKGISPNQIQQNLNLYFQCCSITINSKIGSMLCSTLENGGICPVDNQKIYSTDTVRNCLALMYVCGMYDYSGKFTFEIGLPGISGLSGCIFLVIPNVAGICIYSPPLDDIGNSVRGIKVCQKIIEKYNYHIFENIVINKSNIHYENQFDEVLIQKLLSAAYNNELDKIKEISEFIDLNQADYDKRTALHLASSEGNVEIVKFLVSKGCSKNVKDRWGNTPLSEIIEKNDSKYLEIKKILKDK